MEFTREQIQQQFDKLTPELKKVVAEFDMEGLTDILQKKYHLHIDQLGILANEVMVVLVGLNSSVGFRDRLRKSLGITEDVANLITYDLNQELFSKIRAELAKMTPPEGQTTSTSQQIYNQKMSGVTNAPKQTVEVNQQTGDNKTGEVAKPPRDPYREAI